MEHEYGRKPKRRHRMKSLLDRLPNFILIPGTLLFLACACVYRAYGIQGDLSASTWLLAAFGFGVIAGIGVIAVVVGLVQLRRAGRSTTTDATSAQKHEPPAGDG